MALVRQHAVRVGHTAQWTSQAEKACMLEPHEEKHKETV